MVNGVEFSCVEFKLLKTVLKEQRDHNPDVDLLDVKGIQAAAGDLNNDEEAVLNKYGEFLSKGNYSSCEDAWGAIKTQVKEKEEARKKAEAEAKMKAEAEARKKAEAEARKKAEAEAKMKAEAEARKKAEAEAKMKDKGSKPEYVPRENNLLAEVTGQFDSSECRFAVKKHDTTMIELIIDGLNKNPNVIYARYIVDHPDLTDPMLEVKVNKGTVREAVSKAIADVKEYYSTVAY